MVTRITRFILALQLLVAVACAVALRNFYGVATSAAIVFGIAFILCFRALITANNFFLAWIYRSQTPDHYRLTLSQALRLFFGEFKATIITSSWTMPFHAFRPHTVANSAGLPVLLIHGYGCNSGYWHSMSKALVKANITHQAINMEPVFGSIDEFVPIVHDAVETLCKQTGQDKIIIVGHSMGGLAARAYLRVHRDRRIAKVITLGTPHRGTGIANFGRGVNCEQMRWTGNASEGVSSQWLRELAASETEETYRLFVSIYSHHDNIIAPQTSSYLPGARNIEYHGIGHVALMLNRTVQARVIDEILATSGKVSASYVPGLMGASAH